jgi:hypothetical protein
MRIHIACLFAVVFLCPFSFGQETAQRTGVPICSTSPNEAIAVPTELGKPLYPAAARAVRAIGDVVVYVTVDSDGRVLTASAQNGHPLLRKASEKAASESKFAPTSGSCWRVATLTFTFLTGPPESDEQAVNTPFRVAVFAYERRVRKLEGGKDPCKDSRFDAPEDDAPTLSIKDALEFSDCIEGKLVRLYGIYSAGFEGSVFGAPSDKDSTWLELSPFYPITKKCSSPEAMRAWKSPSGGTFGLVAYGTLQTGRRFGHMGGWDTQFHAICIDEMKKFSDETLLLEYQKPNVQKQILNWYNNKH